MKKIHATCKKKIAYISMKDAKRAAWIMREKTGKIIKAYHCKYCKKFHIGKPSYSYNNRAFWANIDIAIRNKKNIIEEYKKSLKRDRR